MMAALAQRCNLSLAMHRTLVSENFGSLALPVGEFLALEHGLEYWGVADHEAVQVTLAVHECVCIGIQ